MAKKTTAELVDCTDCTHATLMQWWNNPLIAECSLKQSREVARTRRHCPGYKKDNHTKEIKHYYAYSSNSNNLSNK